MNSFPITIYHNPKCGTSRNTLAMIRSAGYEPAVVEYLETGWERLQLMELLASLRMRASEIMRTKGTPAEELGLTAPDVSDDAIIEAMLAHPILVNRPIVVTPKGAKLCRPSEVVLLLLEKKSALLYQRRWRGCHHPEKRMSFFFAVAGGMIINIYARIIIADGINIP